jgi:leukotriene-A4 hydrolase
MLGLALSLGLLAAIADHRQDSHSFADPGQVVVTHLDLDLTVDFAKKELRGTATLKLKSFQAAAKSLTLDTRKLHIDRCAASSDGTHFQDVPFHLGKEDAILGAPLVIETPPVPYLRITYHTAPTASGLQWLSPAQTSAKKQPFLFTQSQAIHARSWIPLQDSPGVRLTYNATIRVPGGLTAVMSAARQDSSEPNVYRFSMPQPIPSYLIALAVGKLQFQKTGPRTGVWAEPNVLAKAAKEFEDMELMLEAVEKLYGPYRWERYDILVLPPSFPFGGMENPRVTFATPTVLAGDKSLVSLVAHEMAHSWSGNLVTNATWRDFWLNEGFTVYLERRILEQVYGPARAAMEAQLGRGELEKSMKEMKSQEQILHIDLTGQDPDDNVTDIPYEKGYLFLLHLEKLFGRERFDPFLKSWFNRHAFRSVTTDQFVEYLQDNLLQMHPELARQFPLEEWIGKPGIPQGAPQTVSESLEKVQKLAAGFAAGNSSAASLPVKKWSTQEWMHFLRSLPETLPAAKLAELDQVHHLTQTGNSEILCQWLEMAIRSRYDAAYPRLEEFLVAQGRRKYVKPLYEALAKTDVSRARAIYAKARPGYHPITAATIDQLLK